MTAQTTLTPVLVQVGLTFVLLLWLGAARINAVRTGKAKLKDIALSPAGWPVRVQQIGNAYNSQLQVPMLFYVLVAFALILQMADGLLAGLAWLFVGFRAAHAWIHVTNNNVLRRFQMFISGVLILIAMWLYFTAKLFMAV